MQWKKKKNICFGWKFRGCTGISEPCLSAVRFACRGIIWSDCFSCRHTQLVCPLNVRIFIMSNIKVKAGWSKCQILAACHTVTPCRALHISCNTNKELLRYFQKKKQFWEMQIVDDRWLCKMENVPFLLSHIRKQFQLQKTRHLNNLETWHIFMTYFMSWLADLTSIKLVLMWTSEGKAGQRTKTQLHAGIGYNLPGWFIALVPY